VDGRVAPRLVRSARQAGILNQPAGRKASSAIERRPIITTVGKSGSARRGGKRTKITPVSAIRTAMAQSSVLPARVGARREAPTMRYRAAAGDERGE